MGTTRSGGGRGEAPVARGVLARDLRDAVLGAVATGAALLLAAAVVPGLEVQHWWATVVVALAVGALDLVLRPGAAARSRSGWASPARSILGVLAQLVGVHVSLVVVPGVLGDRPRRERGDARGGRPGPGRRAVDPGRRRPRLPGGRPAAADARAARPWAGRPHRGSWWCRSTVSGTPCCGTRSPRATCRPSPVGCARGTHRARSWWVRVPSTTPASQAATPARHATTASRRSAGTTSRRAAWS